MTKGSFFHHFDSKEALALAAADYWIEETGALFAAAPFHQPADPVERLLAYVDFRKAMLLGELPEFTCLVGTMVQEVYDTHPALREACNKSISGHAATLVPDIEEAMPVSYTHLDVYKRQLRRWGSGRSKSLSNCGELWTSWATGRVIS